ncbi:trypsin-like peptidase domain-containing protein [Actinoplanes sp. Pm04-4]|uniref:Trypsin-like peptidase domain-containing protein n=1 Tax=Paractinoplanes pyxinae TaxID=2997416 RepID=A0ABT4AZU0_9ACTN|nr:trypsin-like peptidase domain-containing protein [Actinoplanes pyxinae]MCY1139758.1 trypsin-like peptidase domain-containing protein [Actinoplanes pyxinae]
MRTQTRTLIAGAVALCLASGIVGGLLGAWWAPGDQPAAVAQTATGCDVTDVAGRVFPSLVTIQVAGAEGSGLGSGSVLDREGNILTNDHVISSAAAGGRITVDFARGAAGVPATVVGRDPSTDLAVLRVAPGGATLTPIAAGDSSALVIGQPVVAAGSPLGLSSTITAGVVSALNRYVDVGQGGQPSALVNAVQTDAAINPGNSGGPLVDCSGRQVGVNSAGAQVPGGGGGSIGLNFAIPMDFARSVAAQLISTGKVTHPSIGVLAVTVTDEMARATGLPRGALIDQALPGMGAARAGLREGDVLIDVGGKPVDSVDEMLVAVRAHSPGQSVQVTYVRDGKKQSAPIPVSAL